MFYRVVHSHSIFFMLLEVFSACVKLWLSVRYVFGCTSALDTKQMRVASSERGLKLSMAA